MLGPPLAGLLFAVSGTRLVLGVDALTFLVVIPLALRLPTLKQDTNGRSRPLFFRDARDGLAFIRHTPYVLAVAVGFWVVVLFSAPDDLILPFLATVTFKAGPVAVGVLLAAASAGLLAGLLLVGPVGRRLGVTGAIVAGFAVMATGNLLTAGVLGLGRRGQDGDAMPGGGLGQRGEVRRSGGWRGQCEGLGGLTSLGGELLEPGRAVQGEEPCGGRRDDVGVAKTAGQYRDCAGPGGVLLPADEYLELAIEHEEGLVVQIVDVDGAGVAALGEVVGQGEGPAGLRAADAHLGQGTQEPDGRLGVSIGDNAACHGRDGFGHDGAPSRAGGSIPRT